MSEQPEETQETQPRKRGADPIDIPVPTREAVFGDLEKVAKPKRSKGKRSPKK